jgi:glycogen debranching enzyme
MSGERPLGPGLAGGGGAPSADGAAQEVDPYYILASSPAADEQTRVLKQGDTFAVFDHFGDVKPVGLGEEGLYHGGTRFLSCLLLSLRRDRPMFLSSTVREDNDVLAVDLTNPDVTDGGKVVVPRGTVHIARTTFLWKGVCYERLRLRNYQPSALSASFTLLFKADFADLFEVRGARRPARGRHLGAAVDKGCVTLAYEGLDRAVRRTRLLFSPVPSALSPAEARYEVTLPAQGEMTFDLAVVCEVPGEVPEALPYDTALDRAGADVREASRDACALRASNDRFNDWVDRAVADMHMMVTDTPWGPYPYAGVPWFSTPFGRDGIITALELLWFDPSLARGVLSFLAATQATEVVPEQDAQPGKVLHEMRRGEMAALGEIPFGRYYGSVDATPLFVVLAGAYHERTGDLEFVRALWPNVESALGWVDGYGDPDHDGFVEYARTSPQGLVQQGWKDSHDSVFHADGTPAEGPIALCEVQGYVYAAKNAGAALARALGLPGRADEWERQARELRERFEEKFWCEEASTYALALDGEKRPCRVRTSNAGQVLFTGIASAERARRVARTLLDPDSFSGWGVRTVAATEARYNPMSYHNGSVWPHDNALLAWGLSRYALQEDTLGVLTGMFEASQFVDLHRLPELFCGFPRRPGEGPTLYPVACAPQSWAAAAVFLLVQSCLGLTVDGVRNQVSFRYPLLPGFLPELRILNLQVGRASVDLLLRRHGKDVGINVLRREGGVEICMVK